MKNISLVIISSILSFTSYCSVAKEPTKAVIAHVTASTADTLSITHAAGVTQIHKTHNESFCLILVPMIHWKTRADKPRRWFAKINT